MLTRNVAKLSVGELGSRVPLLLLEVTLARLLGPALYGVWSVIQTFATYGNFLHFGVVSSLARREPGLIERGERDEVLAYRAASYGFQIVMIASVAALFLSIYMFNETAFDSVGGLAIAIAVLVVIMAQQITLTTQASAMNEYKVIESSAARLIYAFLFLIIGIVVVRFQPPLLWLTIGWAGSLYVALGVLNVMARGILVIPTIDHARTAFLLKDGFPIMLQGLLRFGLMSIDKLAVFAVARPEAVGYYGIGSLAAGVTGLLGTMIARVSLPTLLRMRERAGAPALMQAEFAQMLALIQSITYGVLFILCAFSPILVYFALPAYNPAMQVIGVLAIAGGFAGLSQAMSDVAMSLGVKAAVLLNTSTTLAFEALFLAVAWRLGAGIEGMAIAVLVAMFLMCGRALWLAFRATGLPRSQALQRLRAMALLACVVTAICLGVLELQIMLLGQINQDTRGFLALNFLLLLSILGGLWYGLKRLRRNLDAA